MIPDKIFKSLSHKCKGYQKFLKGESIEQGYKPDYVLKKGNDYIILESENSSSRKTFVGGMVKAAHFLRNEKTGTLVFIIVPKVNTKAISIANHLEVYFNWLKNMTNLEKVIVIEANKYYTGTSVLEIGSTEFQKSSMMVNILDDLII